MSVGQPINSKQMVPLLISWTPDSMCGFLPLLEMSPETFILSALFQAIVSYEGTLKKKQI